MQSGDIEMKELLQQALDALTRLSFLGNGDFPGNSEGNRIAQKAVADIKQALSQQEQPNRWSEAVIDQLVVHHIYQAAHDTDPRKAVKDLLGISNSIALDPQVSSDAQALIDRGRREAQQEQPAQEPVGFTSEESIRALKESGVSVQVYASRGTWFDEPLYTRPAPAMPTHEAIYETIINWDEGGKRSRRELARRIEALYTHSVPTQPALSDKQILDIFGKVSADGMGHYMTAVGRAIEAHCRGGASHE